MELMHACLKVMVARGRGHCLNVASIAAFYPGPMQATYHATKAFMTTISRAVDYELRGTRCSVTVLCPGFNAFEFTEVFVFKRVCVCARARARACVCV